MIKYLITKKVKDESMKKTKKALIYSGIVLTGIGAICSYNVIKKMKYNNEQNEQDTNNDQYKTKLIPESCGCGCHSHKEETVTGFKEIQPEEIELEEKIKEFNSQRITDENTPDASKDEMQSKLNKVKDTKGEVIVNKEDYQKEKYEEYEYYEDSLKKEEQ